MSDVAAAAGRAAIGLNRSERVYLAMEGVAGAIHQTHLLRFRTNHGADQLRAAVRALFSETPRLRARPVSTLFGWRLAVRPEGPEVDRLFERAWRVIPGVGGDEAALRTFLIEVLNEPFDLQGRLPMRVYLLEGGPRPLLVFNLHHVVCDGRGMLELLARLMGRLNGERPAAVPVDSPSMIPALLPAPATFIDTVRSLWRSFWLSRRAGAARRRFQALVAGTAKREFGHSGVRLHRPPLPLKAIKETARHHGCTVTELMVAVLAHSFGGQRAEDGRNAVIARLSLDLRPYFPAERRPVFGNYVASFLVSLPRWRELAATIADVREQLRDNVGRFERKEMSLPFLAAEVTPRLLGRKLLGQAVRALKRQGRLQPITFHYSNIGSADSLNSGGPDAQLEELTVFGPAVAPFFCCVGLADRLSLGVTYPDTEIADPEIGRILAAVDDTLAGARNFF